MAGNMGLAQQGVLRALERQTTTWCLSWEGTGGGGGLVGTPAE